MLGGGGEGTASEPLEISWGPERARGLGSASILTGSSIWAQQLDNSQVAGHGASNIVCGQVANGLCWVPQVRSMTVVIRDLLEVGGSSLEFEGGDLVLSFGWLCDLRQIS